MSWRQTDEYRTTMQLWLEATDGEQAALERLTDYWKSGVVDAKEFDALFAAVNEAHARQIGAFERLRELQRRHGRSARTEIREKAG